MKNIVLIGMPGSGKSTVGVLLAKMAGMDFLDSDLLIQKRAGKRLFEIIKDEGIETFLELENIVNSEIEVENTVIATGGSVIYCEEAMNHLKSIGTVIYLKVPTSSLESRITNFSTRGIVIKKGNTLGDLFSERNPLYKKYADITVELDGKDLTENAKKLLSAIEKIKNV